MSVLLMARVWALDLGHDEQAILIAMADHAHDDGTSCFPGVEYLAWKAGYSGRTVQRILRKLEEDTLIEALRHQTGGRGHATEYQLHLERGARKPPFNPGGRRRIATPENGDNLSPFAPKNGDSLSPFPEQRVTDEAPKGDIAVSPQPSVTIIPSVVAPDGRSDSGSAPPSKPKRARTPRPPTPMETAVYAAWGVDPAAGGVTKAFAIEVSAVAGQLASAGADHAQVAGKKAAYERDHPRWDCTPRAVAKHWPLLRAEPERTSIYDSTAYVPVTTYRNPFAQMIRREDYIWDTDEDQVRVPGN